MLIQISTHFVLTVESWHFSTGLLRCEVTERLLNYTNMNYIKISLNTVKKNVTDGSEWVIIQ